jgi:hypothetical protein
MRLRPCRQALATIVLLVGAVALVHELYFVELWIVPTPARAGEPFSLMVDLRDRRQAPVTDHRLEARVEATLGTLVAFPVERPKLASTAAAARYPERVGGRYGSTT